MSFLIAGAQTEFIVTVNPTTGNSAKVDSIPGVRWLHQFSTYNQTTKEYTVMGSWEQALPPVYLYTINAITGSVISKPLLTFPIKIISMQYSRSTGILYGLIRQNNVVYLATINTTTGVHTLIKDIPNIDGVGSFTIDEANQRLYLRAADYNAGYALWTIDLLTGNIIYHVTTQGVGELRYDNSNRKLYAISNRPDPIPGRPYILSLCTVDPVTGIISNIADLPGVRNIVSGEHGTINENDHIYFFVGVEAVPPYYLYSVNATTGSIISKAQITMSSQPDRDNLIFFRYDNISGKLYGLLWEAKTIVPPPNNIDSTCRLDLQTKIYADPSSHNLVIHKKPTTCKATVNVYNAIGQLIIQSKTLNDGRNDIPLSGHAAGIYFYQVNFNNKFLLSGQIIR